MDAEDDENEIHIRLGSVLKHYNASFADAIKGGFHLVSLAGEMRSSLQLAVSGKIEPTPLYNQLLQAAGDLKPKMIGIASAANIFAGNENDRSQVQQFVEPAHPNSADCERISSTYQPPELNRHQYQLWPFRQHPMAQCRARTELP